MSLIGPLKIAKITHHRNGSDFTEQVTMAMASVSGHLSSVVFASLPW
jgi:hypothetical protein